MPQRRHALLEFVHLFAKTAVIEKPGCRDVVHILDAGIGGVAIIQRHPGCAGAHQAEHADEHACVVGGIDGGALFIAQAFGAHGAGDLLRQRAHFPIRIGACAIENRDAVRLRFGAFVEIVDCTHGMTLSHGSLRRPGQLLARFTSFRAHLWSEFGSRKAFARPCR